MIPTGHFLVGGAVGAACSVHLPPEVAVPVALVTGVVSHHILDWVPHTDADTFWPEGKKHIPPHGLILVVGEFLLGIALTVFFFLHQHTTWAFLAGALGGMLPDFLDTIPLWKQRFRQTWLGRWWHHWHHSWHCSHMGERWVFGVFMDVVVVCGGIWFLRTWSA